MAKTATALNKNQKPLCERLRGKSFRELLGTRGISRYRLARDTGISYRTLQYWEKGRKPSEALALKVGEYLGLTGEVNIAEMQKQIKELSVRLKRLGI